MKKIKPIVIGYHRVMTNGSLNLGMLIWEADEMAEIAVYDFDEYKIKSKFRPVYNGYTETE